jgi:hypothetical protein
MHGVVIENFVERVGGEIPLAPGTHAAHHLRRSPGKAGYFPMPLVFK